MEVFVARQPILDVDDQIYGFELLYRNSKENNFPPTDGNKATKEVLINSFVTIGLERLSHNRPCFINFTEDLLMKKIPEYFDPRTLVVEILEDVSWTGDLLKVCRELKRKGFSIALDDVMSIAQTDIEGLLSYVDIIKVDIRQTCPEMRVKLVQTAKAAKITLLAEKVETKEEHLQCVKEGFHLFQGYYYSKPVVLSAEDLPLYGSSYFQVLKELSADKDGIDLEKVIEIFEGDLTLTYKLLRIINFSAELSEPIQSIRQAVTILGVDPLKKWLYVFTVEEGGPAPASKEMMKSSLQRAKMCEQIGVSIGKSHLIEEYFLTGLMSAVDAMVKRPTEEVISNLPLDSNIKQALSGEENSHRFILDLVIAIEKADFDELEHKLQGIEITLSELLEIFGQAIAWTEQLYNNHLTLEELSS
ncbi:EAL domain-containing protein [Halobacillus sp. A1]|uniref:EAL and HDOD domain-containing protein n=1 Tax=Halobacillus sp. A1 TaxID=2880262 RepID=UPI0020A675E6|nr:EAL domain-containing protein [Halobacillus sp. A1]